MAFIVGGSLAASARKLNGPGVAPNAAASQPCGPLRAVVWHAWQPAMSPPHAPTLVEKAFVEWCDESAPGFANFARNGPHILTRSTPAVTPATEIVKILRRELRLRAGTHFGMARLQAPLGRGPIWHGPPNSAGRVQRQRPMDSPFFVSNSGLHS
jgi:hypothetical protein